jgi:hypothetical protein
MPGREHAQEVRRCIIDNIHGTPIAKWASQNLTVLTVLLRADPEPTTPEEKKLRQHLQTLLDAAAL